MGILQLKVRKSPSCSSSFFPLDVKTWRIEDVGDWLNHLGLGQYQQVFSDNQINGRVLMDFTREDLDYLQITILAHRKTLLRGINDLKQASEPQTSVQTPDFRALREVKEDEDPSRKYGVNVTEPIEEFVQGGPKAVTANQLQKLLQDKFPRIFPFQPPRDMKLNHIISSQDYLKHEYIETSYISTAMEKIRETLKMKPNPRFKPVLATLRGVGGGKTRFLEEIQSRLNLPEDLPIAITFNGFTEFDIMDFSIFRDKRKIFALNILARVAAAIYGNSSYGSSDYQLMVRQLLQQKDFFDAFPDLQCELLLREFFRFLMKQFTSKRNLILLVDEIAAVQEQLEYKDNILSTLSHALLDDPLSDEVQTALVISSLALKPIAATESGRYFSGLRIPEELNLEDVINKWAFKDFEFKNKYERCIMKVVLSCFNCQPRTLEFCHTFIKDHLSSQINGTYVANMFQYVFEEMERKYPFIGAFPDLSTFLNVLNSEKQGLDANSLGLIRKSILINSPWILQEGAPFYPKISIASLYLAAKQAFKRSDYPHGFIDMITNMFDRLFEKMKTENFDVGDLLEILSQDWLKMKIRLLSKVQNEIHLKEFFQVPASANLDLRDCLRNIMVKLPSSEMSLNQFETLSRNYTWNSYHSPKSFYELLNTTTLTGANSLQIIIPGNQEAFDHLLIFHNQKTNSPFLIFFECKSKSEKSQPFGGIPNGTQFNQVLNLQKRSLHLNSTSPVLKAFQNNQFLYFFLTTSNQSSTVEKDNCVVFGLGETERYFTFMTPLLKALRESC